MKKIFLVTFLLFLIAVQPSFAHFFASDGTIRAVIHIDPEDSPIAGEASTLHIDIVDQDNKFSYENCNCRMTIVENNKQLFSTTLTNEMGHMPVISYVFPERNVYQFEINGQPKTANVFEAFDLKYDIRVEKGKTVPPSPFLSIGLVVFVLVTSIIGFIMLVRYAKK